jgi:hypothetical protein
MPRKPATTPSSVPIPPSGLTPCNHKCKPPCNHKCAWCKYQNSRTDGARNLTKELQFDSSADPESTSDSNYSSDSDDDRNDAAAAATVTAKALMKAVKALKSPGNDANATALQRKLKKMPTLNDASNIAEVISVMRAAERCQSQNDYEQCLHALSEACADDTITAIANNTIAAMGKNGVSKIAWHDAIGSAMSALFDSTPPTELMNNALSELPGRTTGTSLAAYYAPFKKLLQDATWLREVIYGQSASFAEWEKYQCQLWLSKINAPWTKFFTVTAKTTQEAYNILAQHVTQCSLDDADSNVGPIRTKTSTNGDRLTLINDGKNATTPTLDKQAADAIATIAKTAQEHQRQAINAIQNEHHASMRDIERRHQSAMEEMQDKVNHHMKRASSQWKRKREGSCSRCPSPQRHSHETRDCRRRPSSDKKQKQECFDFKKGKCTRGTQCRYAHVPAANNAEKGQTEACLNFQKGTCTRGQRCRYSH